MKQPSIALPSWLSAACQIVGVLGLACLAAPAIAQDAPSLPNGATSLQETYEDWLVACGLTEAGKRCVLSQQQTQQNGQRVLAIELTPGGESVAGSLVLPFGLSFAAGAGLQVDEKTDQAMLSFSTCLPIGCVVRVDFDRAMVEAMRTGNQLKINVRADGAAEPTAFGVSLKGFSAALERTRVLLAS